MLHTHMYLVRQVSAHTCKDSADVQTILSYGPRREKTCLRGFANNTGADQPAHPRRLINAFVIRFLESIICKLAAGAISML